ncbi:hypothetical protein MM221_06205 [Salipaludibacillus sp. LMS25]|jgi:hypothetical protein|uniref:DUF6792 domain-containing protein n=1 Tax=Salipaludibacillus sp. LMS25 TaxID=2924031 RepID=UPI0020D1D75E|nr:DUF6792 domain-containing protein [Salipaludibacillus sp. LMS25]UTR16149.1 hypothetical protein MM221_06205 [Salipaludibacillus sp. LMS25]
MGNKEVLDSDQVRARMIQMEYKELTESEIRRIYIEETGTEPPANITVYSSDDYPELREGDYYSGFDGSAIHFYDEEKGINQVYTITRGSEGSEKDSWKPKDWFYNLFGIGLGQNASQLEDAGTFVDYVMIDVERVDTNIPLKSLGMGHSLGGNLITTLQLVTGQFDNVYAVNHIPPSMYQLVHSDPLFALRVSEEFNINLTNNFNNIYDIDPTELKEFTEAYYKERIDETTINRLNMEEDLLYAMWGLSGFIDIGVGDPMNSIEGFDGLHDFMSHISDEDMRIVRLYFAQFVQGYNKDGFDGAIREIMGLRSDFIDDFADIYSAYSNTNIFTAAWSTRNLKAKMTFTIWPMLWDMGKKVPQLYDDLVVLYNNIDPLLDALVDLEVITPLERQEIKRSLGEILESVGNIKSYLKRSLQQSWSDRIQSVYIIYQEYNNIMANVDNIKLHTEGLMAYFGLSADAHKMTHVVNALGKNNGENVMRVYEGGDMYFIKPQDVSQQGDSLLDRLKEMPKSGESLLSELREALSGGKGLGNLLPMSWLGLAGFSAMQSFLGVNQPIKVNISSAVRIYQKGQSTCDDIKSEVAKLKRLYESEYEEGFSNWKSALTTKMNNMEQSPRSYQQEFFGHYPPSAKKIWKITKITVHEEVEPLPAALTENFDSIFAYYEEEVADTLARVELIKESIETLFSEEEEISQLFTLTY